MDAIYEGCVGANETLRKIEPEVLELDVGSLDGASLAQFDPNSVVKRALKNRYISLLALGGIIGPGCLIGAGNALNKGGPLALLLDFGIIGAVCFSVMESMGELVTLYPSDGGFKTLARRFHSNGLSAVSGYAYIVVFLLCWQMNATRYHPSCSSGDRRCLFMDTSLCFGSSSCAFTLLV